MFATTAEPIRTKPLLRGVSHEIAFYASLVAGVVLFLLAPRTFAGRAAALVYSASISTLYGISALYHRPTWTVPARQWMRRLDHSAIFVMIAGSYTPLAMLVPMQGDGSSVLWLVWLGALLGVLKSLFWVNTPKPITAIPYVVLGWIVFVKLKAMSFALGPQGVALLVASGVIYTIGAVVYALRRPDPFPRVFGYHEIFHALVIVASVCHFTMVVRLMRAI